MIEKTKKKTLTVPRQRKLRKEFPDGKAVGRAFVQFYLDQKRKLVDLSFTPALTSAEMKFLRSTVIVSSDQDLFKPYYILEKVLHQFEYWIDHYEHVYYHGLFKDLAAVQTPDYDIQIYHFIKSQTPADEEAIEKAKSRYNKSLEPILDILIPTWDNFIASPIRELHSYSFRLEKIQELMNFDFSCMIPDMKHHEGEIKELQRLATVFLFNVSNYIKNDGFEVSNNIINNLRTFINFNVEALRLSDAEKEDNTRRAIATVNMMKGTDDE